MGNVRAEIEAANEEFSAALDRGDAAAIADEDAAGRARLLLN
jgi:hypothetical protein